LQKGVWCELRPVRHTAVMTDGCPTAELPPAPSPISRRMALLSTLSSIG
jgi:hypothetical protein